LPKVAFVLPLLLLLLLLLLVLLVLLGVGLARRLRRG
jgi:hypothetical protein